MRDINDWIVVTKKHTHWTKGHILQPFSYNIRKDVEYLVCTGNVIYVSDDKPFIAEYGIKYIPKSKTSQLSLVQN